MAALYQANNLTPEVYFDSHNKRHFKAPTILPDQQYVLPSPDKIKALEAAFWERMKPSIKAAEGKSASQEVTPKAPAKIAGTENTNKSNGTEHATIQPSLKDQTNSVPTDNTTVTPQTATQSPEYSNSPEAKTARNLAIVEDLLAQNHSFKASVNDNYWHGDLAKVQEFKRVCQENEEQILALKTLLADQTRFKEASEKLKTLASYDPTTKRRSLILAQKFSFLKQNK